MLNGFLIVDKPLSVTSSDVVVHVRKRLVRGTSVGHGGTLDPEASGVLPVCIGKATRLFDYIIDKKKTYLAEITLGVETDTQDAAGEVISTSPVFVGAYDIMAVLPEFIGDIMQVPPMYSAIKLGGVRMYELARRGETVKLQARACHVYDIRLLGEMGENKYALEIDCGKGTYIRTLCADIGKRLGCGAHMSALRRTAAGVFTLDNAYTLDKIDELFASGGLDNALLPIDAPLSDMPLVRVGVEHRKAVENGNPLRREWLDTEPAEITRVYLGNEFAGIAEALPGGSVKFRAMLM